MSPIAIDESINSLAWLSDDYQNGIQNGTASYPKQNSSAKRNLTDAIAAYEFAIESFAKGCASTSYSSKRQSVENQQVFNATNSQQSTHTNDKTFTVAQPISKTLQMALSQVH